MDVQTLKQGLKSLNWDEKKEKMGNTVDYLISQVKKAVETERLRTSDTLFCCEDCSNEFLNAMNTCPFCGVSYEEQVTPTVETKTEEESTEKKEPMVIDLQMNDDGNTEITKIEIEDETPERKDIDRITTSSSQIIETKDILDSDTFQYREDIVDVDELAEDIKLNGQINPITVRKIDSKYEIISGFRRRNAIDQIPLEKIQAVVYENLTDQQAVEISISENIHRKNLNDLELINVCKMLKTQKYSTSNIAKTINRTTRMVCIYLEFTKEDTPEYLLNVLRNGKKDDSQYVLGITHAHLILRHIGIIGNHLEEIIDQFVNLEYTCSQIKMFFQNFIASQNVDTAFGNTNENYTDGRKSKSTSDTTSSLNLTDNSTTNKITPDTKELTDDEDDNENEEGEATQLTGSDDTTTDTTTEESTDIKEEKESTFYKFTETDNGFKFSGEFRNDMTEDDMTNLISFVEDLSVLIHSKKSENEEGVISEEVVEVDNEEDVNSLIGLDETGKLADEKIDEEFGQAIDEVEEEVESVENLSELTLENYDDLGDEFTEFSDDEKESVNE